MIIHVTAVLNRSTPMRDINHAATAELIQCHTILYKYQASYSLDYGNNKQADYAYFVLTPNDDFELDLSSNL